MKVATYDSPSTDSFGEEIANAVTHGIALLLAIAGLVIMVVDASIADDGWALFSAIVYGTSLVLLFLSSTLYHALRRDAARRFFLAFDHIAIFLLIAGTYTPIALLTVPEPTNWILFALIWGLAVTGMVLRFVWLAGFQIISLLLYLVMGWISMVWANSFFDAIGGGVYLIIAGGACFTLGVLFYLLRRLPYNHAVWHLFVLGGAICHFLAVQLYAMPMVL
ncbi:MAG TPA: hemolysin III family protein [Kiloniellales bacterium]|nr:hemolysin III family protein [Kiloniellales bacterium]